LQRPAVWESVLEMPESVDSKDHPFWTYSLSSYKRTGVGDTCLTLQDSYGLNVNLLLYCLWAGACGISLTAADLIALRESQKPWDDNVVKPLRSVRRWLKGQSSGPPESSEALRQAVLAQEIEGEAAIQWQLWKAGPVSGNGTPSKDKAFANLRTYVALQGSQEIAGSEQDLEECLTRLVGSAF